jgi:hypothetical protein
MTDITETPLAALHANGNLLKQTLMADTHVDGRFGFRGEISYNGDEIVLKEAFATSEKGQSALGFLAGSIDKFATLPKLVETFGAALDGNGVYLVYIADLPRGDRYLIQFGDVKINAIFIDDTSVYNELIDTFYVDKAKLKKYDTSAKLDALADVGVKYASGYAVVAYDDIAKKLGIH